MPTTELSKMNKRKIRRRSENSALSFPGQDFEEKFGSGNKEYIDQESSLPCGTANTSRNTAREDGDTQSNMTDRAERLETFQSWPHDNPKPEKLAKAGFYLVKEIYPVKNNGDPSGAVTDLCRCFACGVRLDNWKPDDDPFIEHARHNHQCRYISQCKGKYFISAIQHLTMKGIIKPTRKEVKEWMTKKKAKMEICDAPVPTKASSASKAAASAPKTAAPAATTAPTIAAPATTTAAPVPTTAAPSTTINVIFNININNNNSNNRDNRVTNTDNSTINIDNSNSITNNDNSTTNIDTSSRITTNTNNSTNTCEVQRAQNLPINCTVNNNLQPPPNDDSDEKDDEDDDDEEEDDDGTVRNASSDDDAH